MGSNRILFHDLIKILVAMQKLCCFSSCAVPHFSSQSHYMYIWQRGRYTGGGERISHDQILWNSLCIFNSRQGTASLHFTGGRKSYIHLVCLIGYDLWRGSACRKWDVASFFFSFFLPSISPCKVNMRHIWISLRPFTLSSSPHYHSNLVIWAIF